MCLCSGRDMMRRDVEKENAKNWDKPFLWYFCVFPSDQRLNVSATGWGGHLF